MASDLEEARRLMRMVAKRAPNAGPIEANTVINMAQAWAHIALAEAAHRRNIHHQRQEAEVTTATALMMLVSEQLAAAIVQLQRIADALETRAGQ